MGADRSLARIRNELTSYKVVKDAEQVARLRLYTSVARAVHAGHSQRQALIAAGMVDTYWVHLCKALDRHLTHCLEPGCVLAHSAEGYCVDHSERKTLPKQELYCTDPFCGCGAPAKAKGLCNTGYQRKRRAEKEAAAA